jgi:hypothetical protein
MDHKPATRGDYGEHPRGTLAIVAVFGVLFFLGWLFMYYVVFAGRGHIHAADAAAVLPSGREP